MTRQKPKKEYLSPEDLQGWLSEEIRNVLKACDLRIKDATDFTVAYALGKLTPEQAELRLSQYERRWEDALGPVRAARYENDAPILAALDQSVLDDEKEARGSFKDRITGGNSPRKFP